MVAGVCTLLPTTTLPLTSSSLACPSSSIAAPHRRLYLPAHPPSPSCSHRLLRSSIVVPQSPIPRHAGCRVVAEKTDFYKVVGTAVKTARDALEAGTKLVPEAVPRPLAQAGVAVVGLLILSYVLKSVFSIVLFVLAIGSVSFLIFFYLNKDDDEGNKGGGGGLSNDQTLEEARRIMEKYK